MEYWEVWYPSAAATGVLLARGQIDPADEILFHSAADVVTVQVTGADGNRLAFGENLRRTQESPICRLRRVGDRIVREDVWPGEGDVGAVVLLPGGEAGKLLSWWNAPDRKEWRWRIELYNNARG